MSALEQRMKKQQLRLIHIPTWKAAVQEGNIKLAEEVRRYVLRVYAIDLASSVYAIN